MEVGRSSLPTRSYTYTRRNMQIEFSLRDATSLYQITQPLYEQHYHDGGMASEARKSAPHPGKLCGGELSV